MLKLRNMSHLLPILDYCYDCLINCEVVLFPGPVVVNFDKGGMKSGWCMTSLDNTIAHLLTILDVAILYPAVVIELYGDDNISCCQDKRMMEEFMAKIVHVL